MVRPQLTWSGHWLHYQTATESVSEGLQLPKSEKNMLKMEALFNDAFEAKINSSHPLDSCIKVPPVFLSSYQKNRTNYHFFAIALLWRAGDESQSCGAQTQNYLGDRSYFSSHQYSSNGFCTLIYHGGRKVPPVFLSSYQKNRTNYHFCALILGALRAKTNLIPVAFTHGNINLCDAGIVFSGLVFGARGGALVGVLVSGLDQGLLCQTRGLLYRLFKRNSLSATGKALYQYLNQAKLELVVIDPVFADEGKFYPNLDERHLALQKKLLRSNHWLQVCQNLHFGSIISSSAK